jgi:hypothetical protein
MDRAWKAASALLIGLLTLACGPNYKSGETQCADDGSCPAGYSCAQRRCYLYGELPTGAGGSNGGGGRSGAGGATAAPTCDTDEVFCPARGGASQGCWRADTDCSTLIKCGTEVHACPRGEIWDCRYVTCSKTDTTCSDKEYPQYCPARGQLGAQCWGGGTDCGSIVSCAGRPRGCEAGYTFDCAQDKCVSRCTDPASPQYCPARAGVEELCIPAENDCATTVKCAARFGSCPSSDQQYDCAANRCNCKDPTKPQVCPAVGELPAACWPTGVDCSTTKQCADKTKINACPTGKRVDPATCTCV